MGRLPKTTEELRLSGCFRPERHGDRLELEPDGTPQKPDDLDADASELWDAVIDGVIRRGADAADSPLLAAMCRWFALYRRLERQLANGTPNYNTTCQAATAFKQFAGLAAKFGLTPGDRAKLKTGGKLRDTPSTVAARNRQAEAARLERVYFGDD